MNVVGSAIVTPIIAIVFVGGVLIGTGEFLLYVAEHFSMNASIAAATALMFAYSIIGWVLARGE